MVALLVIVVLGVARLVCSEQPCPALPGQLGRPQDLDISTFSASLDPEQVEEVEFFIEDGIVSENISSLDYVSASFPGNLTSLPVLLQSDSLDTLYFTISMNSLDTSVGLVCPAPHFGQIEPATNQTVDVTLSCNEVGVAIQQVCLTIGTQDFTILNGTYHTFTFYIRLVCSAPTPLCQIPPDSPAVIAEMCVSVNMSLALVESGSGSWSLLAGVLRNDGVLSSADAYCFIDEDSNPPGIIGLLREDSINIRYAIPISFDVMEVFLRLSKTLDRSTPLSYSIMAEAENKTVLGDPVTTNMVPQNGVTYDGEVGFVFDLTCKNPGITRIYVFTEVSVVNGGHLHSNSYSDLYFYRNCSNDTVLALDGPNIGVEVGVSLAVVFVLLVGVAVLFAVLMTYFTRRHRKKTYLLEQEHQMELLASSNAYMLSNFENELGTLRKAGMEYNYSSLELLGELGEGAFGKVYKAVAPGLQLEGTNFVAVKLLKDDAESDVMSSFIAEVQTSAQFKHPNVIKLLAMCTGETHKCMIFEYMDLGGLNDVLRNSDPTNPSHSAADIGAVISPKQFLSCCLQLAQGVAYLASLKFVHRDIATRNCLINNNFTVKIADFGMSREVCAADYYRIGSAKACLPVRWMPPEALLYGKFTVKSDVWSYGVVMWEIYSYAHQPFGGISNFEVIDRIKNGQMLDCPELCPASMYDIMKSCWTRVPQRRPAIASVLQRIGHLLRSNSMNTLDDYTTMGSAEGYLNLSFSAIVTEEELEEKRRVDAILESHRQTMEEMEVAENSDEERGGAKNGGEEMGVAGNGDEEMGGAGKGGDEEMGGAEKRGDEEMGVVEKRGDEEMGGADLLAIRDER